MFFRAFKYCSYVVEPYNGFDPGNKFIQNRNLLRILIPKNENNKLY